MFGVQLYALDIRFTVSGLGIRVEEFRAKGLVMGLGQKFQGSEGIPRREPASRP